MISYVKIKLFLIVITWDRSLTNLLHINLTNKDTRSDMKGQEGVIVSISCPKIALDEGLGQTRVLIKY